MTRGGLIYPPRKLFCRLASLGCALLVCACGGSSDASLSELIASARWIEPRLSLDDVHSCGAPLENGRCLVARADNDRDLLEIAAQEHTLGAHERALFHLVRGSDRYFPQLLLERHLAEDVDSAPAWSDLSAVLLLGATDPWDWRAYESAIVAAEKALEIDADYERAHFNLALAFGMLALDEHALDAWTRFRELAGDGPWAREAGSWSSRLTRAVPPRDAALSGVRAAGGEDLDKLAAEYPSEIRRYVFSDSGFFRMALTEWPEFCDGQAANWRLLGERVLAYHDDAFLLHAVDWICSADAPSVDAVLTELAQAIHWHDQAESGPAAAAAANAMQLLTESEGPLSDLAVVLRASALLADPSSDASENLLSPNIERFARDYPWLAAWAYRILATIRIRSAHNEAAVDFLEAGVGILGEDGARDPERSADLSAILAEAHSFTGRYAAAWKTGLETLRGARGTMSSNTLSALCEHLALIAAEASAFRLQELYSDCSIRHLADDENPAHVVSAYIARAKARVALRRTADARDDLVHARAAAATLRDPEKREQLLAYVDLNVGLNRLESRPREAIDILVPVKNYFARHENFEQAAAASGGIADAYLALDDSRKADSELDYLAALAAQTQLVTTTVAFSMPIHEHYRPVVERRVRLRLNLGDDAGALHALLEARSPRSANDDHDGQALDAIVSGAGDEATLVLAWLGSEIAGWLLDSTGVVKSYHVPAGDARILVARAAGTDLMPLPEGKTRALSALHALLIEPVSEDLERYEALRIVPDGVLFGIPFPALRDARTGTHLVQEIALTVAPDLVPHADGRRRAGNIESIGVFAASGLSSGRPLPAIEAETRHIADLFASSADVDLFTGANATRDDFLRALGEYDLVHFGGHGEVDLAAPLNSRLIVGESGEDEAAYVTAQQLYDHTDGDMPRIVVLAACDTAAYTEQLPHALALVRPLLERGAGEVIGSLRPIPDDTYLAMMEMFYSELRSGSEAADALRAVQIRMASAAAPEDPGHWGYIQVYRYF